MILWLAYGYARLLLTLGLLLFTASLLLHVSVLIMGRTTTYDEYGLTLFRVAIIVAIATGSFVKNPLRWVDQIKRCPGWMWRGSLMLGVYGFLTLFFPQDRSDRFLTGSGGPLFFEAVSICILYSVLSKGYLEKPEVSRRALQSVVMVGLLAVVFLAFRAGYLQHSAR